MPDYKDMYFKLAAQVATAIELLTDAQLQGEDAFSRDELELMARAKAAAAETAPPPAAEK